MPFKRDLFSGELVEVPSEGGRRRIIARTSIPEGAVTKRCGSLWGRPWRSLGQGGPIENMEELNRTAVPGARYVPSKRYAGLCELECDSRRARANELGFRGNVDFDGGYGDMPRTRRRRAASKLRVVDGSAPASRPTWREIYDRYYDPDERSTHYENCWRYHPVCAILLLCEEVERLNDTVDGLRDQLAATRNERDCQ